MFPCARAADPGFPGPAAPVPGPPAAVHLPQTPAPRPPAFMSSPTNARRMVYAAWILAAVAAVLAVLDLALPQGAKLFGGQTVMDVLFLVSAAVVGYLGYDAFKDIR